MFFSVIPNSFYQFSQVLGTNIHCQQLCQEAAGKVFHWEVDTVNQVPASSIHVAMATYWDVQRSERWLAEC